jgi:FAD/FMN-containing dehydrogenase/Fe-S oxidoreductase
MVDFAELKRQALAQHLRRHIQGEVRFDSTTRRLYSTDASIYQIEPLGVVLPKTAADVQAVVQITGEMKVPLTARGGGTSLSGQSIGPGVVLDCSKYLNAILEIDPAAQMARVQPGIVLDQLNRAVAAHGLQFGPDVATASRANLGGMIGNNSAGSRSIVYGKTIDHVRRLDVILADGSRAEFGPLTKADWERKEAPSTGLAAIYRAVRRVILQHAAEIRRRFPRILRRVSGYNLDTLCNGMSEPSGKMAGLHQLIVGSEGTLAVTTEAELALVPRPNARGLLVAHFASLGAAMDALTVCLESGPSAVELMDRLLLDLARGNLALKNAMAAVQGRPAALLMVEFSGEDPAEIADRAEHLERRLAGGTGLTATVAALDPAVRDPLWNLRRGAMPLLLGLPGDRKPVTFIEDTAVAPARLPEYVARFQDVLRRHGTEGAFYGHASVGCLHIRPVLDLKDKADVQRMRRIAEDITDLVLEFGGALSGEHGDGLARSEWNRKMFGDEVYQAFRQVKHAFDPGNLLNPGRIVDAPAMTENLRYGPGYAPAEPATIFDYSRQEGFVRSIELCNGSGVCRKLQGGTMCPSFRATRDEKDSTRGRANALRLALAGERPLVALRSQWVHEVLDLCLMCKACKAECPSNVDMAKLKAEFLHFYYRDRPRPLGHRAMAHIYRLNALAAPFAPLVNWLQRRRLVRWLLEMVVGIDRRRSLPDLHANHLRRWFARRIKAEANRDETQARSASDGIRGEHPVAGAPGLCSSFTPSAPIHSSKVVLLDDCFTTFNEPDIGRAAVAVFERAGCTVELAGLTCCGRPLISKGFLQEARALIQAQAPRLARRLANGVPLLGLEPSCLLTLTDEWPELVPGPATRHVAAATHLAEGWLSEEVVAGRLTLPLASSKEKCVLHGHCHQKALVGTSGTVAALRLIPDLTVQPLDSGCCGMAGSFGFEKEHYDVSVAVAGLELLPALQAEPDAVVIAPGTSCRHQIWDLTGRRALHPLEVLAGASWGGNSSGQPSTRGTMNR